MTVLPQPVMSPEDYRLIRDFVVENFGLLLEEGKESFLSAKLRDRLEKLKFSSFREYYAYLKYSVEGSEEHARFISLITNNETYFFREKPQLEIFANEVLPALKEKKLRNGERRIRVISAGCSSGEEVYTLAMLILDSGIFAWDWDVRVIGVDVDDDVLAKAERGIYSGRAFQAAPVHYVDRYFKQCSGGLAVRDMVRGMTSFIRGNLLDFEKSVSESGVDVIFCRNVLIYFNDDTIKRIIGSFGRLLGRDGLLFLGHAESLARITDRFAPLRFPGAIIYKVRD
jgi:chemotaxis protein methyltransferase CheR